MRFLLILIIVVLAAVAWWPDQPVPTAEESVLGPQLVPLNKAKNLEEDYLKGLDEKRTKSRGRLTGESGILPGRRKDWNF